MKLLTAFGVCALVSIMEAAVQSVGVRGTLMCGTTPLSNILVKLAPMFSWFDPAPDLACVTTDSQGNFQVQGFVDMNPTMDPTVKIYTVCNDTVLYGLSPKPCQRKILMRIPSTYVNNGQTVTTSYDTGVINMQSKQTDEERKCSTFEVC